MRRGLRRLALGVVVAGALAAIAVAGGSAADFDIDGGPCRETPGEALLLRCPTAYVGTAYQVQIESEEGSGCSPNYDYFVIVNSSLPPGLTMSRDGLISGVPTVTGFTRFWIHDHDLSHAQGGPDWCLDDDVSEHEFSIYVDPGLEIASTDLVGATVGQAYSGALTAKRIVALNPPTGDVVPATWSLESGALPPGVTLSPQGALSGTPTTEGRYVFVVKAGSGSAFATKELAISVRQPVVAQSPFAPAQRPRAEVGARFGKAATATGGTGTYTWALASGALPAGLALNTGTGAISGVPQSPGSFPFALKATDAEGRVATVDASLTVAPRLTITATSLRAAKVGRSYRARIATAGGVQPLKWRVLTGRLPKGIRLDSTHGTLAGTPASAGSFGVTLRVTDGLKVVAKKTLRLVVTG
jgi:large repetitive protein